MYGVADQKVAKWKSKDGKKISKHLVNVPETTKIFLKFCKARLLLNVPRRHMDRN
jgi:hypothetical protein